MITLVPTKNDTPHPKAKEKPQQDSRKGEIAFRIKSHTRQRCSEGSNKTLCTPGSRDPTETEPDLPLSVSCRGTGEQWPASGTGALAAADLRHVVCGTSPLRGDRHWPHHTAAGKTTHKLQNDYTKEILTLLRKC